MPSASRRWPALCCKTFAAIIAGAAINVLVAWGCTLLVVPTPQGVSVASVEVGPTSDVSKAAWNSAYGESLFIDEFDEMSSPRAEAAPKSDDWGSMIFLLMETRSRGFGVESISVNDRLRSLPPGMTIVRAGWPMHALEGRSFRGKQPGPPRTPRPMVTMHRDGIAARPPIGPHKGREVLLPMLPIWPGFAINSLLFAAMAWLLCALPSAVRRRRRRARGQCEACGYPRGEGVRCSECGGDFRAH